VRGRVSNYWGSYSPKAGDSLAHNPKLEAFVFEHANSVILATFLAFSIETLYIDFRCVYFCI